MFDSSRLKGSCKNCDNHALLNVLSAIGAHWAANSIQLNRLGGDGSSAICRAVELGIPFCVCCGSRVGQRQDE